LDLEATSKQWCLLKDPVTAFVGASAGVKKHNKGFRDSFAIVEHAALSGSRCYLLGYHYPLLLAWWIAIAIASPYANAGTIMDNCRIKISIADRRKHRIPVLSLAWELLAASDRGIECKDVLNVQVTRCTSVATECRPTYRCSGHCLREARTDYE
jgi:hypothetical protein